MKSQQNVVFCTGQGLIAASQQDGTWLLTVPVGTPAQDVHDLMANLWESIEDPLRVNAWTVEVTDDDADTITLEPYDPLTDLIDTVITAGGLK